MRNVSNKSCRETQNTHFVLSNCFSKIMPFTRKCGKNIVEWSRPQMTIWRMRIACWIPKATNTHSEYVILIAFPLQTMFARRRLNVILYVHCLSVFVPKPYGGGRGRELSCLTRMCHEHLCDAIRSKWWRDIFLKMSQKYFPWSSSIYEGWNFNSGNYLFTTDTK